MPSLACRLDDNHIFVGSAVGQSVLMRVASVEEVIKEEESDDVKMETDVVVEKVPDAMAVDDEGNYISDKHAIVQLTHNPQTSTARQRHSPRKLPPRLLSLLQE